MLFEHVGDTDDVDRPAGGVRLELLTFLVLAVEGVFGAVGEGAEALGLLLAGAAGNDGLGDVVALEEQGVALGLFHGGGLLLERAYLSYLMATVDCR